MQRKNNKIGVASLHRYTKSGHQYSLRGYSPPQGQHAHSGIIIMLCKHQHLI